MKYLKKARLDQKGYTVHCLRHTWPPSCSMPACTLKSSSSSWDIEDIEITRRYARLTDKTREEEYFRAMAMIEKGGIDGDY